MTNQTGQITKPQIIQSINNTRQLPSYNYPQLNQPNYYYAQQYHRHPQAYNYLPYQSVHSMLVRRMKKPSINYFYLAVAVGGSLVTICPFLPWIDFFMSKGVSSANGLGMFSNMSGTAPDFGAIHGIPVLIAGLVVMSLGFGGLMVSKKGYSGLLIGASVFNTSTMLYKMVDITGLVEKGSYQGIPVKMDFGLYMGVVGSMITLVASVLAMAYCISRSKKSIGEDMKEVAEGIGEGFKLMGGLGGK
ncbi:MAG: hypothetical protein HXX08_04175 [Chloroflexi bacterium]|uniref:Uncharacterized protein n=1 Tax=Candidatus Chlorohelix allophototropha TaxID=3003348 RepID=A0A8T7LVZ0_9CHLR|nr:hypothetical protein [Chloroflexota bacterium]WJW66938.1 hypothetical protein OZ401_000183 [Chloroflexota bacterium L227-S17]